MTRRSTQQTEVPTARLKGHALRRIQKLNQTLRSTRAAVRKAGENPRQSIALLIAETRVLTLQMARYEFGRLAAMHFHAVKNVETPGTHPQHESLSRVYRSWQAVASEQVKQGLTRRRRQQAEAACRRLLELLVPETDDDGRTLRGTVDGLYQTWMYQVGREAFEAASKKTNRRRVPLSYGTLWQRRDAGMVPDWQEVRSIGATLAQDLKQAEVVWCESKLQQLHHRGVPAPLAQFTVAIQRHFDGLRMTSRSIQTHLKVNEKVARAINNGEIVRFAAVRRTVNKIMPRSQIAKFTKEWTEAYQRQTQQESFGTAFSRISEQNGWNNHMLAKLLDVRAPEKRNGRQAPAKRNAQARRREPYRPSAEIRRMYQENAFSGQAPARAAIDLIARSDIAAGNKQENQQEYLTRLFLDGIRRQLAQKGNGACGSELRLQRILCGVPPQQLADASGNYSSDDILLAERGIRKLPVSEKKRLLQLTEQFAAHKVEAARARLAELTSPPPTIQLAVARLKERHGGYVPLSRLLHDESDRRLSATPGRLKRIEAGDEIPSLPFLKSLIGRAGGTVSTELVNDWYRQMPVYLATHPKFQWRHPLARGFGVVVFEQWHSLHDFWLEQFQYDFSYSVVTRNFQQLNGAGYDYGWPTASRYLNAAGLELADPRRAYLQMLFQHKDALTTAIANDDQAGKIAILRRILRKCRKDEATQAIEHTLGLTEDERR